MQLRHIRPGSLDWQDAKAEEVEKGGERLTPEEIEHLRKLSEVRALAVLEAQELLAVLIPAAGFLPQLARNDRGQEDLLATRPVHFLANNSRYLLDDPPPDGQERVHPGGDLAQVAPAYHQDMRGDFGLGRGLFERRNQGLGKSHGEKLLAQGHAQMVAPAADAKRWSIFLGTAHEDRGKYVLWEWALIPVGSCT